MARPANIRPSPPRQRPDDGRWYSYYQGSQIALGGPYAAPNDVEAEYAKLVKLAADGLLRGATRGGMTMPGLIGEYLKSDESPRSRRQRERYLQLIDLIEGCFEAGPPAAVDFDVQAFLDFKAWLKGQRADPDDDASPSRWCRDIMNAILTLLRRVLKFGKTRGWCRGDVVGDIRDVAGIRIGDGRETAPVRPADPGGLRKVLPKLPPPVAALAELQSLTGARAGELLIMRPADVERSGSVWCYRPTSHKGTWRGGVRQIFIGPKGQKILKAALKGVGLEDFVFSPRRAEADRLAAKSAARVTPLWPSHKARNERIRANPKGGRKPGPRYTTGTYRKALERGCEAAKVAAITPHRLRHLGLTEIRKQFGLEAAAAVAGHRTPGMTGRYTEEAERELARKVMGAMG